MSGNYPKVMELVLACSCGYGPDDTIRVHKEIEEFVRSQFPQYADSRAIDVHKDEWGRFQGEINSWAKRNKAVVDLSVLKLNRNPMLTAASIFSNKKPR